MNNISYGIKPELAKTNRLFHGFSRVAYSIQLSNTKNSPDQNHRIVNLALETVLEFNNKDHSADVQFLDNVESFLKKVRTVINRNRSSRRDFRAVQNVISLTDFIQEFFAILNTYPDPEFLDAFDILDEEIRKYHYRGCKFYELTENYDTRRLLATKLDLIRDQPVYAIKSYINLLSKILKQENYEIYVQDLLDYINSLYREDAGEKFRKVLADFEHLNKLNGKRSNSAMVKVIRNGIRSIIFDHYTNLNPNARRELKSKIETFWKQYNTVKHSEIPVTVTKIINVSKIENSNTEIEIPENIDNDDGKAVSVEKLDPKTVVVKKEENINAENHRGDSKRIDIKKSDYKIRGYMRDGIHKTKLKESKNEKTKAPKFTYVKKDSGNIEFADTDETLTTSRKEQRIYQPTMKKATTNQLLRSFSTEEVIRGDSFEDNSIEFEQEGLAQMANAPPRYITLYPEPIITLKQAIKNKADKVIHRSQKIYSKPKLVTLWVEESTGRLPGAPRDKLSSKAHQKPKHKREHKSDHKKHKSRHNLKQTLKHKANKRIKHAKEYSNFRANENKKKAVILTEGSAQLDLKVTALEMNEFKKMMEPMNVRSKFETPSIIAPTTKNIMVTEGTVFKYAKRNPLLPQTKLRDFRKFVFPVRSFNSNPGMSIEQFNHYKKRASLRKSNINDTGGTEVLDQNFINRIKNLERDLKDVKSKMNDVKIDELIVGMDKHEPKQIGNQFEATAKNDTSPQESNLKKGQLKYNAKNRIEYRTVMKVAAGTATKSNEKKENMETPEMKGDYVTREVTKTVDNKVDNNNGKDSKEKETKQDAEETEIHNDKKTDEINLQKKKGTKEDLNIFVNEDKQPHIKMHDFVGSNIYDDVDEWKDAFQSRMKFTNTKGTSTTLKTITQTETTTETTTEKPVEEITTPTRVEIFIPVSIPTEFMPSYKPPNIIRKNEENNLNLAQESVDPMSINPSNLDSTMAEPVLNISNLSGNDKDIEKEVMDMLKMNNITIPKDNDDLSLPEAAGDPEGSRANFLNTISPPKENETDHIANILLTNPFKGEDELDFLTTF